MLSNSTQYWRKYDSKENKVIRRICIVWPYDYPRGGATSNYVQYLSSALKTAGYDVCLYAFGTGEFAKQSEFQYRGIKIVNVGYQGKNRHIKRLMHGRLLPFRMFFRLLKNHAKASDLIITRQESGLDFGALAVRSLVHCKTCTCPLEWFPEDMFSSKARSRSSQRAFRRNARHDLIFPISHYIEEQFAGENVKSLVLPPMIDVEEYPITQGKAFDEGKYHFIFSANGYMKDSLGEMLQSIAALTTEERERAYFHFTGVKEEKVLQILGEEKKAELADCLCLHKWMEYEELVALYRQCHYLFLARKTNQMTLANFPSKIPEALAYGVVPVASNVGEYAQYFLEDGVNAIMIQGYEVEACVKALRTAINMPHEEYAKKTAAARHCAETKFDYHNYAEAIRDSIETLY